MQIKIVKKKNRDEIKEMLRAFEVRHRSLASLTQKVSISKCSSLDSMIDLVLWKNLKDGAEFSEEIVFENSELFETLSPRRIELMEYLSKHDAGSIRQLSEALHRNYKNTYDDIRALMQYELVELLPAGRSMKPFCSVKKIETSFDE